MSRILLLCNGALICCRTSPTGLSAATVIGKYVTVGQGCLLRSATVEDKVVIGDRSILMEGCLVESNSVLAPGTVLPPGRLVPSGQLWAGNPARYVRDLSKDEVNSGSMACGLTPCCHLALGLELLDHHCVPSETSGRQDFILRKLICSYAAPCHQVYNRTFCSARVAFSAPNITSATTT